MADYFYLKLLGKVLLFHLFYFIASNFILNQGAFGEVKFGTKELEEDVKIGVEIEYKRYKH